MRLFYFHAVPFVEQTLFYLVEELGSLLIGKCFDFYNFPFLDVDSKWCVAAKSLDVFPQRCGIDDVGSVCLLGHDLRVGTFGCCYYAADHSYAQYCRKMNILFFIIVFCYRTFAEFSTRRELSFILILLCAKLHNNSVISNAGIQKSLFLGIALHILHRQSLVSDIEFLEFACSLEEMLGFIF